VWLSITGQSSGGPRGAARHKETSRIYTRRRSSTPQLALHCENLARKYEEIAADYDALAEEHDALAKNPTQ
jgi:hypothetical protein